MSNLHFKVYDIMYFLVKIGENLVCKFCEISHYVFIKIIISELYFFTFFCFLSEIAMDDTDSDDEEEDDEVCIQIKSINLYPNQM